MPTKIPIQVVERIIDYLWYDPRTLSKCALTSRDWASRCCYHFCHMLYITDRDAYDNLSRSLLHHETCDVPMREITMRVIEDANAPFFHLLPFIMLTRFPHITFVSIRSADWRTHPVPISTLRLFSHLKSLTHLSLSDCHSRHFVDFRNIVTGILKLEDLRLWRVKLSASSKTAALGTMHRSRCKS